MKLVEKLLRVRSRLAGERGFSLIELMVVLTILGLLSAVSVVTITVIMNSHLRSTQLMVQQTTIENTYGFLASRLAATERSQIGLPTTVGDGLDPLSVAGDQLVFQSNSNVSNTSISTCYRLMYLASLEQIRVASSSEGCDPIQPKRGPNQQVDDEFYVMPGEPRFDPAIDLAYPAVRQECARLQAEGTAPAGCSVSSWAIAEGIVNGSVPDSLDRAELDEPVRSTLVDGYLPPFAYLGLGQVPLSPAPDRLAGVSTQGGVNPGDSAFYADILDTRASIGAIQVRSVVSALEAGSASSEIAEPRYWQQDFSVAQQCFPTEESATGGAGLAPVTLRYKFKHQEGQETSSFLAMEGLDEENAVSADGYVPLNGMTPGKAGKYQVTLNAQGSTEDLNGLLGIEFIAIYRYPDNSVLPESPANPEIIVAGIPSLSLKSVNSGSPPYYWSINLSSVVQLAAGDKVRVEFMGADLSPAEMSSTFLSQVSASLRLDRISS